MMRIFYALLLSLSVMACQPAKQAEESQNDSTTVRESDAKVQNGLTSQQIAEGWISLFDGESMKGWHIYKNKENDSWEVTDGTLHCKPFKENETNKRADLITNDQYENFELVFDWKISPQGNSGVIYRVSEEYDQPYASGPEYQVLDDEGYPGDLKDVQLTAANYDMQAPSNKATNPPGQWNQGKIVANQNHIEHWLNGEKVLEYELGSEDWNKRRTESKWKDFPGYGLTKKGHIDLQDHGNEVWFRNIMIKPL